MKITKRSINGILLLDKPKGISSNHALQKTKRLFQAKKAGHTGSLDPLATGMLPICFGIATKFCQYLLDANKVYEVQAKLGVRTNTGDAEGEVIASQSNIQFSKTEIEHHLSDFRGTIAQVPPMYSALKHQGKPLYQLARAGQYLERPPRTVTIYLLEILDFQDDVLTLKVACSKGTYIRSLVDDLGMQLGCGAHVIALRRTLVNAFENKSMISISQLESLLENHSCEDLDRFLLPIESIFSALPAINLTEAMMFYMKNGRAISAPAGVASSLVRCITGNGQFLGLGEITADGMLYPRRWVQH